VTPTEAFVIIEPVNPERLPIALIMPIPAAAATPDKTVPGNVQKIGIRLSNPDAEMLRKRIDTVTVQPARLPDPIV
jgi:hypothetical protein